MKKTKLIAGGIGALSLALLGVTDVYADVTYEPSGSIVASGEDGVPWELYENGYLLFKPSSGKDTLTNKDGEPSWKKEHGSKIKYVGSSFSGSSDWIKFKPIFIDTAKIDTTYVVDMTSMFDGASGLTTLDVGNWNTSRVKNMRYMFIGANTLKFLDVSKWDTSNVKDMNRMFAGANSLISLDVSKWDTSKVEDMTAMFDEARSLKTLDVSNWNTRYVERMEFMFEGTTSLTTLDVSNWDTRNVHYMDRMFKDVTALTTLNIGNWNVSKVMGMRWMFEGATGLTTLNVGNWNVSRVIDMEGMFKGASGLTTLDIGNWDLSNLIVKREIFDGVSQLKSIKLPMNSLDSSKKSLTPVDFTSIPERISGYTNKWKREDGKFQPYTWNELGNNWRPEMAGTWVREKSSLDLELTFDMGTHPAVPKMTATFNLTGDDSNPFTSDFTLPTPNNPENLRFVGWVANKDRSGTVITNNNKGGLYFFVDRGKITLYPK